MWRRLTRLSSLLLLLGCAEAPPDREVRLRAAALLSEEATGSRDHTYSEVRAEVPVHLPQDHGAHPSFRQEWWYWTFLLWHDRGRKIPEARPADFGAQLVFFRRAVAPHAEPTSWRATQVYMSHFAVTHVARKSHRFKESLSRQIPGVAGIEGQPFAIRLPGSSVRSLSAKFTPLQAEAHAPGIALHVRMEATRPAILQGDKGFSAKSASAASHYYSMPRLAVRGTLGWDDETVPVLGWAWLDREWSTQELPRGLVGWDWMALTMRDGSEIMLYRLVRTDGSRNAYDYAMIRDASGRITKLGADEFDMRPLREVNIEGQDYVMTWEIDLKSAGKYRVHAVIDDQYLATSVGYWEGLVRVSDLEGRYVGDGYLEMTR